MRYLIIINVFIFIPKLYIPNIYQYIPKSMCMATLNWMKITIMIWLKNTMYYTVKITFDFQMKFLLILTIFTVTRIRHYWLTKTDRVTWLLATKIFDKFRIHLWQMLVLCMVFSHMLAEINETPLKWISASWRIATQIKK